VQSKVYVQSMTISTTARARRLRVAELASAVDVSPDTIRYYEREGLLPAPERSPAGYRLYDRATVERLRFIQGCQRLGLRLREIGDLLAIRDTGSCPCEPAADLLHRRLAEVDAEMARLASLREQIVTMVRALPADDCPPTAGPGHHLVPTHARGEVNPNARAARRHVLLLRRPRLPTRLRMRLRLLSPSFLQKGLAPLSCLSAGLGGWGGRAPEGVLRGPRGHAITQCLGRVRQLRRPALSACMRASWTGTASILRVAATSLAAAGSMSPANKPRCPPPSGPTGATGRRPVARQCTAAGAPGWRPWPRRSGTITRCRAANSSTTGANISPVTISPCTSSGGGGPAPRSVK